MLSVEDPRVPQDAAVLDHPGAFAWWYADGLDAHGNGLVLIASWALPFWPGDRAARLAGRPVRPRERPSMNLAVYRAHRQVGYWLVEAAPEDASWSDEAWQIGGSRLTRETDGVGRLRVAIDLPVAGSTGRLRGTIVVEGPLADGADGDAEGFSPHRWAPVLGPAHMRAELTLDGLPWFTLHAPGYHDRNLSWEPLDALGIDRWTWGRQIFGDQLVIHYLSWPSGPHLAPVLHVVVVDAEGHRRVLRERPLRLGRARSTWLGMPWWEQLEVDVDGEPLVVRYQPPVDTGPFYLRCMTTSTWKGHTASGWAEVCLPDRIDQAAFRPLVAMCVHPARGAPSLWLPLFSGTAANRWSRLRAWWTTPRPPRLP